MDNPEDVAELADIPNDLRERLVLVVLENSRLRLDTVDEAERVVAAADTLAAFIEGRAVEIVEDRLIGLDAMLPGAAKARRLTPADWTAEADTILRQFWPSRTPPRGIKALLEPEMGLVTTGQIERRVQALQLTRSAPASPAVLARMTKMRAARAA